MVYDPAKRHDYYLRTRQLKGRNKAQAADIMKMDKERANRNNKPQKKKTPGQIALENAFNRRDSAGKDIARLRKAGKMNSPEMDAAIAAFFKASEDIVKLTPNMAPG